MLHKLKKINLHIESGNIYIYIINAQKKLSNIYFSLCENNAFRKRLFIFEAFLFI